MAHKICKASTIYKLDWIRKSFRINWTFLVLAMSLLCFCWHFVSSLHCKSNILWW